MNSIPKDFVDAVEGGLVDEFTGFDGMPLNEIEPNKKEVIDGLPKGKLVEEPVFKEVDYNLIEG